MGRLSLWVLLGLTMFALSLQDVQVSADVGPSESECRPYIEKAINELKTGETTESSEAGGGSQDVEGSAEDTGEEAASAEETADADESAEKDNDKSGGDETAEEGVVETVETGEESEEETNEKTTEENGDKSEEDGEQADADDTEEVADQSEEGTEADDKKSEEAVDEDKSGEETADDDKSGEETVGGSDNEDKSEEKDEATASDEEENAATAEDGADQEDGGENQEEEGDDGTATEESGEDGDEKTGEESAEGKDDDGKSEEEQTLDKESGEDKETEGDETEEDDDEAKSAEQKDDDDKTEEDNDDDEEVVSRGKRSLEGEEKDTAESKEDDAKDEDSGEDKTEETDDEDKEKADADDSKEETKEDDDADDGSKEDDEKANQKDDDEEKSDEANDDEESEEESQPEDDLLLEVEIPENLRDRKQIDELLHLDEEFEEREKAVDRVAEIILRDLKRIYENAVKPLETLYKYRDLSNRHFSDPEIFSKPLILFMGPWSGGKSTIINYLTDNEYTIDSLRTGAEPSPAYFNIVMYGNETEVLDGTQMAADWTFSGLQKFGQGLEERLRGLKLPNKLLEKVNIVEIPGILEVRKQVSRLFPFNDACQWFIDRADIIFLVYDPAKLDVGPETEAILDQLKGREYQTRIILNKADTVKPEELLRVQSALIWNISPLMSSAQPPVMYTTSLWSHPYETSSPIRLLQAQERAFLRDIRGAIDKRIENKIASARRFAVRVRNHAKMVDCYLNTYYNHKTLFGNKKRISDQIIENPQNYHIYEGLSTLTNISRYDLPDPEVYRDFFRLNPLYEFKKLSETCTYFRGCPINKLDVAIAYDLPELVGKYKKMSEAALTSLESPEQGKS